MPAEPRPAATVVLLRDGPNGVEALLLRRPLTMAFAGGMTVFPGGSVEPADGGPDAAAARETAEECGVRLDPAALKPWSRWVSPEEEPRRYDTWFYVAALPRGQQARAVGDEAIDAAWTRPAAALADPTRLFLPPTRVTLEEIAAYRRVSDVLATDRALTPIRPRQTGADVVLPGGRVIPLYDTPRPVTPEATVVRAQNPSPMTLSGTNSWLVRGSVVVDPGPDDERHLAALAAAGRIERILLTHRHPDHSAGAARLAAMTGATVGGKVAGLEVIATPGHTDDSVCFVLGDAVLTGDTILGEGTTVVEGSLADHLRSLRRLARLGARRVLPGHGPVLPDVSASAAAYLAHREERLEQVRAAVRELGDEATPRRVVERVYADVESALWPAAERSVRAQFEYLYRQDDGRR